MNAFENMCKELNKRKRCNNHTCVMNNEYICAKQAVKEYTNGNRDKLLKLKGEAIAYDWWVFASSLLAVGSLVISLFTLNYSIYCEMFADTNSGKVLSGEILFTVAGISLLIIIGIMLAFRGVLRWKGYILVAIEELEKTSKE